MEDILFSIEIKKSLESPKTPILYCGLNEERLLLSCLQQMLDNETSSMGLLKMFLTCIFKV